MSVQETAPAAVRAHFFDGRTSRAWPVQVTVAGAGLVVTHDASQGRGEGDVAPGPVTFPVAGVQWPERSRHGARIAQLPGGASLQAADAAAWDAWAVQHVRRDSLVVHAQQSWRGVLAALAVLVAVLAGFYAWGLPAVARGIVALVPPQVDLALGEKTLRSLDGHLVERSRLPPAEQERIRALFQKAVVRTHGTGGPAWRLEFRRGRPDDPQDKAGTSALGPNAFALPGGTMVLTDELVELVKDDEVLIGVLGHELGHVRQRHGMRQLVQVSVIGAAGSILFGDYGSFLATAPVVLASMGYSRDAEREADGESLRLMKAAGVSPLVMVRFFEMARSSRNGGKDGASRGAADGLGIAFSSHPHDAERIARFRQAARGQEAGDD